MTIDYQHKSYQRLKQFARDVGRHMFEQSGKRYSVQLRSLQHLDFQLTARQCYRGCHACCFDVLGECMGTVWSRSYFLCIHDMPEVGDVAAELLLHCQRYCESNLAYCKEKNPRE